MKEIKERGVKMKERETTPVTIDVKTKVRQEAGEDTFQSQVTGEVIAMGDSFYIRYEERLEGVDNAVPVTIKILPDGKVQLIRSGDIRMKLIFNLLERHETMYHTNFGSMSIQTHTKHMTVNMENHPSEGSLFIDYDLYGGEERLGIYQLDLKFKG